jgi:NAD+ diphosphatase
MFKFCPRCATPLADRELLEDGGPTIRLACPADACSFVHYDNPTPAVGVLLEQDGEIILARGAGWPEGFFALITGFLERNEDPIKGVIREVKEETNLDVVETNIIGNYIFERKNEVMLCYHATSSCHPNWPKPNAINPTSYAPGRVRRDLPWRIG